MITAAHKTAKKPSEHWERTDDAITHNDVIEAYLQGKEVGRDEAKVAMNKLFVSNLEKAQKNSEELYTQVKKMGIEITAMHLKADNVTDFMALVIANSKDYVDEKFLKAITLSRKIKNEVTSDDFSINFYFTYNAETLNENSFLADGYFLKYNASSENA